MTGRKEPSLHMYMINSQFLLVKDINDQES